MAEPITRPDEVPADMPVSVLAVAYVEHAGRLVRADAGIGAPLTAGQRAAHALAALAYQHALAERALQGRWVNARDALRAGATRQAVAEAMGLDLTEVVTGLRWWADGQVRAGCMTDDERAEVDRLAGDDETGEAR